jgi:hypothetical protein
MSQKTQISSHRRTPRWTHAIDVHALSGREDLLSFAAIGLSLLAVLRDQPVPRPAVPLADVPQRAPERPDPAPSPPLPPRSPLHLPQEEDRMHYLAGSAAVS